MPRGTLRQQSLLPPTDRTSFADWMLIIRASEDERALVERAHARYARPNPSADEVLEREAAPGRKAPLFHAVVLLALERKTPGVKELQQQPGGRFA